MYPRWKPYEHSPPRRDNIITVAMPGITSTRAQLSRYVGVGDDVTVLQNWSDGFAPLASEDGDANPHKHRSLLALAKRAWRILWSLREEKLPAAPADTHRTRATDVAVAASDGNGLLSPVPASASTAGIAVSSARRPWTTAEPTEDGGSTSSGSHSAAASPLLASSEDVVASLSESPFCTQLATPPVLYRARCGISCRLLHNVLPSPEVTEMVHRRWYATLNPIHWALTVKEIATCLWFSVRPIQLCYSEVGRTSLAGLADQRAFLREVRRAVHFISAKQAGITLQLEREEEQHQGHSSPASVSRLPACSLSKRVGDGDVHSHEDGTEMNALNSSGRKSTSPLSRANLLRPHLVLFGCSRGATTCFYTAMKLPAHLARYVSLVIVEAPFDTLQHVIYASSLFPNFNMWFFKTFCDYADSESENAAYSYEPAKVKLRCPIAFVLSTRDRRVPNKCTQVLIDGVRDRLVPHTIPAIEVLTLRNSRHPCMAVGNREDQDAYVGFVERLYDTYCSGEGPATV